ncbi:MAG: hypothetical protein KBF80_06470 [Flavobacteriales bacterium]|nr:hypothetical protein [Flavobacteriales bacterium]
MTLTLLLQLTYEEQLFAQQPEPVVEPQTEQVEAPAVEPEETCAAWPQAPAGDC